MTQAGSKYLVFMDPRICPACGAPASEIFGARRYCAGCAGKLRAFSDQRRAALTTAPALCNMAPR